MTPPIRPLVTREGALDALEYEKKGALEEFTTTGCVRPRAVLFIGRDPTSGEAMRNHVTGEPAHGVAFVYATNIAARRHAAGFSGYLRDLIESSDACGVIGIFEMWLAEGCGPEDRSKFPKDFNDGFPWRKEGILVSLEHVAFDKPLIFWSPISRDAAGKGTAAPFDTSRSITGPGGNFMNLLRRRAS